MNDPLYGNKIASAILASLLLIFGLPLLGDSFFGGHGGGHHGDDHGHPFPQLPIEVQVAQAATAPEPEIPLGNMMEEMTPSQGERAAAACKSCHTFEKGGAHRAGPNLWDIVNRPVGGASDYTSYSGALKDDGGVWSFERLDGFLKNSKTYLPGTAMAQKVRKDDKRASILVYLSTLSDNPAPFPEAIAIDLIDEDSHGDEEEAH